VAKETAMNWQRAGRANDTGIDRAIIPHNHRKLGQIPIHRL